MRSACLFISLLVFSTDLLAAFYCPQQIECSGVLASCVVELGGEWSIPKLDPGLENDNPPQLTSYASGYATIRYYPKGTYTLSRAEAKPISAHVDPPRIESARCIYTIEISDDPYALQHLVIEMRLPAGSTRSTFGTVCNSKYARDCQFLQCQDYYQRTPKIGGGYPVHTCS